RKRLRVSASAVAELVAALVGEGLVRRDTDPDDRRAVVLALTAEGRRVRERYELAAASNLAQVLGPLTAPQRRRLRSTFADLNAAFAAADGAAPKVVRRPFIASSSPRRSVRRITQKENADAR